ncbi:phosphopantetheine-binding protein [Acinetobacter larvae]|uniref:Carrier domain-containing protein n=1 Tax=Acinetobacter larvae TaxID=1789224 RepID=A0A1B2M196_9GAMM|nr:phosphopantetheine-binding protein [Acinetobacter larvae]AOA58793.1 hypothetical protein BFG52_10825 [Acinetobacter larvae]
MKTKPLDIAQIRQTVATQLNIDVEEIQNDDDLFMLGLDSVSLMTLVSVWRELGINIEFQDLAEAATIQDWSQRLNR